MDSVHPIKMLNGWQQLSNWATIEQAAEGKIKTWGWVVESFLQVQVKVEFGLKETLSSIRLQMTPDEVWGEKKKRKDLEMWKDSLPHSPPCQMNSEEWQK